MVISKLEKWYAYAKGNRWMRYFTLFNRVALAAGFLPAGFVKITGERFASGLSAKHPMGHYLEALSLTGYYYTFIGVIQIIAALLLLIPRTATLGALLYFPIIVNIFILSIAVRFDGSLLSSPLMVLSNLYLLCWDYDKLRYFLPFKASTLQSFRPFQPVKSNSFPWLFFTGVAVTVFMVGAILTNIYDIMPRNTLTGCKQQCSGKTNPHACEVFCDCIHTKGEPLGKSLETYYHSSKLK